MGKKLSLLVALPELTLLQQRFPLGMLVESVASRIVVVLNTCGYFLMVQSVPPLISLLIYCMSSRGRSVEL